MDDNVRRMTRESSIITLLCNTRELSGVGWRDGGVGVRVSVTC